MIKLSSLLLIFATSVYAQIDWRGHNRLISTQSMGQGETEDWDNSASQYVLNHRSTIINSNEKHTFEAAYELFGQSTYYENEALFSSSSENRFNHRVDDFNYYLTNESDDESKSTQLVQNLDRFLYIYSGESIELNFGRQPISFGSARIINPLDVLVPFNFTMVNMEQRLGVDAARLKYSYSDMGMIDFGGAIDKELESSDEYRFLSFRDTFNNLDTRVIVQSIYDYSVVGFDLETSILSWGVWIEAAQISKKENSVEIDGVEYNDTLADNQMDFERITIGGQYHFSNDFDLFLEYHYNGLALANSELGIFVTDKNYFNFGGAYPITPLQTFSSTFLHNLEDHSALMMNNYQYNISQDWYVDGGLYLGIGDEDSEFRQYAQTFYMSLKNYF